MLERTQIVALISECLAELAEQSEWSLAEPVSESTPLMGEAATLDSLGLVNLIVDLEARLLDDFDVEVTLADERAMSLEHSPFRTVGTLAEYACSLAGESQDA